MKRFEPPVPISQRLSVALVRLVFFTVVIVGVGVWAFLSGPALNRIAKARVGEIGGQVAPPVLGLAQDGERLLRVAAVWLGREDLALDHQSLNKRFLPLLAQLPDINSLRIADQSGNEWLLGRAADGVWFNRLTAAADKAQPTRRFLRWKDLDTLAKDERQTSDYQPLDQPWLQKALKAGPGKLVSTEIGRLGGGNDLGTTLALATEPIRGRPSWVLALDLRLQGLTGTLNGLQLGNRGMVLAFSEQGRVLAHSRAERHNAPVRPEQLVLTSVVGLELGPLQDGIGRWLGRNELPLEDGLFIHEIGRASCRERVS
jgi:hypothetical protein